MNLEKSDDENKKPPSESKKWLAPNNVMNLYRLKLKKNQLKSRINRSQSDTLKVCNNHKQKLANKDEGVQKRKNPFVCDNNKNAKREKVELEFTTDQTMFNLINLSTVQHYPTNFTNILNKSPTTNSIKVAEKQVGNSWIPVDWSLKSKMRFISGKPFLWNQKLKISEEASGITSFVRCLDNSSKITLDTSPNAKFHQCCLYWQQPMLPWLKLFPRTTSSSSNLGSSIAISSTIRDSLESVWSDSIRSLFQLIRTRQCPYFYVCAKSFTVLFRAAGICGYPELHAVVTPTTRGFRQTLRQEGIEFVMPLKNKRTSDHGYETFDSTTLDVDDPDRRIDEEDDDDGEEEENDWLKSLGIGEEEMEKINKTQQKLKMETKCRGENSEQSTIIVEGIEVNAFFNLLLNCKSCISETGALAGIPPTLLAPVAFNGATLCSLSIKESKVHFDNVDYFSLELTGPILPHTIHALCQIHPKEQAFTATFASQNSTVPFSKLTKLILANEMSKDKVDSSGSTVFGQANLADCGLNLDILKHFCLTETKHVAHIECLKYIGENKVYTWS